MSVSLNESPSIPNQKNENRSVCNYINILPLYGPIKNLNAMYTTK